MKPEETPALKSFKRRARQILKAMNAENPDHGFSHSQCLENLARDEGFESYSHAREELSR